MNIKLLGFAGIIFTTLCAGCTKNKIESVYLERPLGVDILENGDYLVTDGGGALRWDSTGSKVFIIDRKKNIKWMFDDNLAFAHSAIMLMNGNILIPDTNNDRLIEVSLEKKIIWSSEEWIDGRLQDDSSLEYPNHVIETEDGHFVVSDRNNSRVIEIDRTGKIYWSYNGATRQHAPRILDNGNFLIADSEGHRIIEINRKGDTLWEYSHDLNWPRRAERNKNGETLITDSRNQRLLLITEDGSLLKEYKSNFAAPYEAQFLINGNILVCDSQHARIVELDSEGNEQWEFRNLEFPDFSDFPDDLSLENGKIWHQADLVARGRGEWDVDTQYFWEGSGSLRIFNENSEKRPHRRWWGQRIKVESGESINMFCSVSTQMTQGGAGITLYWIDEWGGAKGAVSSIPISGFNDWTTVSLSAKVPDDIKYTEIALIMTGTGTAWFDKLKFGKSR